MSIDSSIMTEELGIVMRNLGQLSSMDELNIMIKEIDIEGKFRQLNNDRGVGDSNEQSRTVSKYG